MGWNGIHARRKLECVDCGGKISYTSKGRCQSCYGKTMRGKKPWNTGKRLSPEHRKKIGARKGPWQFQKGHTTNVGKLPWNYGKGDAKLNRRIRSTALFKLWRESVCARDQGHCFACGNTKHVEAHHIMPLYQIIRDYKITTVQEAKSCQALWNTNNGILLCHNCHNGTRLGPPRN